MVQQLGKRVLITPIDVLGSDERGQTLTFETPRHCKYLLVKRRAGTISGNHYHEGSLPATNPKTYFLCDGTMELIYRSLSDGIIERRLIDCPSRVDIYPYTVHAVRAATDITLMECLSIDELQRDRVSVPVFSDS